MGDPVQTDRPAAFPEDVNRRILIVDDNQAIHTDFRKILAAPAATEVAMDELAAMLFEDSQVASRCDFELDSAYQGREALDRVTSANAAGQPPAAAADAVAIALPGVDLLLDGGDAPGGAPSTIITFDPDGPVLLRAGAIAWDRVIKLLQ